jgi:hypothetical protein
VAQQKRSGKNAGRTISFLAILINTKRVASLRQYLERLHKLNNGILIVCREFLKRDPGGGGFSVVSRQHSVSHRRELSVMPKCGLIRDSHNFLVMNLPFPVNNAALPAGAF